jgi:mycothiol synthase
VRIRDATSDDLDAVFDLLTARSRGAFGVSQVSRELVANDFEVPGTDHWVATENGSLVGYATLSSAQSLTHAARDPDLGDALLAHAEARARARGFEHLTVTAVRQDVPLWSLVERGGFEHDHDVLRMWRVLDDDLPAPVWAPDVTVRTYTDADAHGVQALLDESYASWDANYVRRPHEDWLAFMTNSEDFDPELWFLVERGGELVACALHWREYQRRGWVKDIVVRASERGRGIGKALLHRAFHEYARRDVERVGLKVDSTNPTGALELYRRVGFVTDQEMAIWIKRL